MSISRKILISDIHGCLQTFQQLVHKQVQLQKSDTLYLLGDYVDRGPDSKGVIDFIWQLQAEGFAVHTLRGNHEQMMLEAYRNVSAVPLWIRNGGKNTLDSFGVDDVTKIAEDYVQFLENLPYYLELDGWLLVHAGLNFFTDDPLKVGKDMIWIRSWERDINYEWLGDRKIAHGHTPVPQAKIEQLLAQIDQDQYINIDCGCFLYDREDKGKLCALDIENQQLFFQENIDMS